MALAAISGTSVVSLSIERHPGGYHTLFCDLPAPSANLSAGTHGACDPAGIFAKWQNDNLHRTVQRLRQVL